MPERVRVAIVDYGMGNLFSVRRACERVGLEARITSSPQEVLAADAVILPGVGAFGDAMAALRRSGLAQALRTTAASGRPLLGICLGMQLFMQASEEFGRHEGLGLLEGHVVRLAPQRQGAGALKVPQVGWNRIAAAAGARWAGTLLEGIPDGAPMYFVHSFHVVPADAGVVLSTTRYGSVTFCSSLQRGNLVATQFHPERSGPQGIRLYHNLAAQLARARQEMTHA